MFSKQSKNRILLACAGSGKTTAIVDTVLEDQKKVLVTTYTLNNVQEITKKFYTKNGGIPERVDVTPWYTFLLNELVRPYQNYVYPDRRIRSISLVEGRSGKGIPKTRIRGYFVTKEDDVFTDKISEFILMCDDKSKGMVIDRLSQIYDRIYIDEAQDLAGWDLELVERLLDSGISISLVADHRQATLSTNKGAKNSGYAKSKIYNKFLEWDKRDDCCTTTQRSTHRSVQPICDVANQFFPDAPNMLSLNTSETGHDGVFVVSKENVHRYVERYSPQILRYSRSTKTFDYPTLNFGDSKGMEFGRVLIVPHGPINSLLADNNFDAIKEPEKLYVAFTRARHSVAILYDGSVTVPGIQTMSTP